MVTARELSFTDFSPWLGTTVGFDSMFDRLVSNFDTPTATNYPPYDIVKTGDYTYAIALAIAGFSKDSVEVKYEDGTLTVSGKKESSADDNTLYRGIATRTFSRRFSLSDDTIVTGANLKNGLLTVELEKIVPEEKKARLIPIGESKTLVGKAKELVTDAV